MNPNLFQVHCTWKAVDGKNIAEAISWADGNENSDIEETIQAENCLLLESTGKGTLNPECRLSLQCQPPYVVQQIAVLCEARLVEVYGQHQEYLHTVRCEMVDEMEDMIVFRAEVKMDKPTQECSVKFTGLKSKTSMWLYGVIVYVGLPMPSSSVLLSAAQRFIPQQPSLQERGLMDNQMMALMALLSSQTPNRAPMDPALHSPLQQQHNSPFSQVFAQTQNSRPATQFNQQQQPFQMPNFPQTSSFSEPVNQLPNSLPPTQADINSHLPETNNSNEQPQVPLELVQLWQTMNQSGSGNAMNAMTDLMKKLVNSATTVQNGAGEAANENLITEVVNKDIGKQELDKMDPIKTKEAEPLSVEHLESMEQAAPIMEAAAANQSAKDVKIPQEPEEIIQEDAVPAPVAAPSRKSKKVISEPLSEAVAVSKLSGAAVEQISESVVTNLECSLEHLEERLWGKVRHRLQDMENKILQRLDEMLDALREEEESEPRDLQEELDDEEETLSMGPDSSVLEI